jgi:hypothetical protein
MDEDGENGADPGESSTATSHPSNRSDIDHDAGEVD